MTTAVARMYVWGKTYTEVTNFRSQEKDVLDKVFAKAPALGLTVEAPYTNSFVMRSKYRSLKVVVNLHIAI